MHHHIAAGEGATPTDRFDLQHEVLKTDRVVAVDRTFELQREGQVQIAAGAGAGPINYTTRCITLTISLVQKIG
jgi:hypothetical protein